MLDNKLTKEKFGYLPSELTDGSNKRIIVQCDYCDNIYDSSNRDRNKTLKIVNKDACKNCRSKKRIEITRITHGVDNVFQLEDVKNKIKKSVENFYSNAENVKSRKEKAQQTIKIARQAFQDKYGVDNPSYVPGVRDKAEQTTLERYGNKCYAASDEGKEKVKDIIKEKYGVENVFQNEEIKDKIKQTNIEKYGVNHFLKIPGKGYEHSHKSLQTRIKNGNVRIYDDKTIRGWAEEKGFSRSRFNVLVSKHGFEKAINMEKYTSCLEKAVSFILDDLAIKYQQQIRVEEKYADFLLTDYNIIIEADGLYWHSESITEDKNYHVKKRDLYLKHGYKPLFFRENEINHKPEIVKSMIMHQCGLTKKMNAREMEFKEVPNDQAKVFFRDNHLMGNGKGIIFGLYHYTELSAAIQLKKKDNRTWEISRFCNSLGLNIRGGFTKLLTNSIKELDIKELITFIDLRYGTGNYLKDFGFTQSKTYTSFKWTNGVQVFHRMAFPSNSGYDKGLVKIWDCGQAKFVLSI